MTLSETSGLPFHFDPADPGLVLLPVGCASREELEFLARELSTSGIKTRIAPSQKLDSAAYTPSRGQYRAAMLLDQARRAVGGRVLAVTDADLYIPDLNFVFGVADLPGRAAVVSLHRLRVGAGAALLRERLLKEALHEIGHTFGLPHCFDTQCVMSFSNSLSNADRKSRRFCPSCREKLTNRIANAVRDT
jgi:archaemetzincin